MSTKPLTAEERAACRQRAEYLLGLAVMRQRADDPDALRRLRAFPPVTRDERDQIAAVTGITFADELIDELNR